MLQLILATNLNAQQASLPPVGFDVFQDGIKHGKLDTISYDSKTVGTARRAVVYLPPGYSKKKNYPVLYLLHGTGENEESWFKSGNAEQIFD